MKNKNILILIAILIITSISTAIIIITLAINSKNSFATVNSPNPSKNYLTVAESCGPADESTHELTLNLNTSERYSYKSILSFAQDQLLMKHSDFKTEFYKCTKETCENKSLEGSLKFESDFKGKITIENKTYSFEVRIDSKSRPMCG